MFSIILQCNNINDGLFRQVSNKIPLVDMKNGQELLKIFGTNVKIRRKRMNLSQEKLGEIIGVGRNSISEIEAGNNFIGADNLARLAIALNTDVYELFKPDGVMPDKAASILEKYGDEVKKASEKIMKEFLRKLKK